MSKRTKLTLMAGIVLAVVIAVYSWIQIQKVRTEQELDRLVQALGQAARSGPAGSAACARLLTVVRGRMAELEARDSGEGLTRIRRGMGDCAVNAAQPDLAIGFYEQVIAATPQEGRAHADLAWAYSLASKHPEAVRSAQLAVQLAPNAWQAHRQLGRVQKAAGQSQAAVESFTRARDLAPPAEQAAATKAIEALQAKLTVPGGGGTQDPPLPPSPLSPPLPLLEKKP